MNLSANTIRTIWTLHAAVFLFLWPVVVSASTPTDALSDHIQQRLEAASPVMPGGGAVMYAPAVLHEIYRKRTFHPAWIGNEGPFPQADALLNAIRQAEQDGLKPEEYHLSEMTALVSEWRTGRENNLPYPMAKQIDLELLLTDALVAYGFHLLNGRVNPEKLYPDWVAHQKDIYLLDAIENAMNSGNIEAAFQRLASQIPLYLGLKQTLALYTNIARTGGWPMMPQSRSRKRMADDRSYMSILKQRLVLTGDLPPTESPNPDDYDESMKKAVRRFQKRHGLKDNAEIGPATLKEMNIPVEKRIEQIRLNLERIRWLPVHLGPRYILVNITDFDLTVFQEGLVVMDMPVVVGKEGQRTSSFSGKMTYLELNPYWNVPKTIAAKEILPEVQKDPDYLTKKNMKVIEYSRPQGIEVDPATIDWSKIRPDKLRYSFRQDSGPGNALGRVKFMFPNKFDIYLHDTPERHLFKRTRRAFSHGCIRIAKPIDLAEYLLKDGKGWNRKKLLAEIGKGKRQIVNLPSPIDVHILYLTAWTDHQGDVQFRNDIYEGDAILLEALSEKPHSLYPDDLRGPVVKK